MSDIVQKCPKFTINPDEGKIGEDIRNVSKQSSYAFWLPPGSDLKLSGRYGLKDVHR